MSAWKTLFVRNPDRDLAIDGIRAIAVMWVILFHAWLFQGFDIPSPEFWGPEHPMVRNGLALAVYDYPLLYWVTKGDLGVDLFFVISGFLIGSHLFREREATGRVNFARFYRRRLARLMPAYWVTMLLGLYFMSGINAERAWSNLLYVNNYVRDSYLGWTWSLAIEEQFYMVIPVLIAFLFPRFRRKRFLFVALFAIPIAFKLRRYAQWDGPVLPFNNDFISPAWKEWFWEYYMYTHLRFNGLLLGVIAAYLHLCRSGALTAWFNRRGLHRLLAPAVLATFAAISLTPTGQWVALEDSVFFTLPTWCGTAYELLHREVFCALTAYIILACLYCDAGVVPAVRRFLSMPLFYPVAQVSYSAYLLHEMLMFWGFPRVRALVGDALSPAQVVWLNAALAVGVILVAAGLMFVYVESPFLKYRRKRVAE